MRKLFALLLGLVFTTACQESTDLVTLKAQPPIQAHSLVSQVNQTSELECSNGGTRLDIYLDMDDSLNASEGDLFQGSLVACNGGTGSTGATGQQGPTGSIGPQGETGSTGAEGPQGPVGTPGAPGESTGGMTATILEYSSSSCTLIVGTSTYIKVSNENASLYSSSSCSSSSKFATVSQGESYWAGSLSLAVWTEDAVRVITYNLGAE